MHEPVYLDYAATTPLRPAVRAAMLTTLDGRWGNPSSVHRWGREARAVLEDARARFAAVIGASPAEVVFTRGGTEADNLAVLGRAGADGSRAVAISAIEHKAVLASAKALAAEGGTVRTIPVDADARVDLDVLAEIVRSDRPAVVSVMWANNEVGVIQPVEEIAAVCAEAGAAFHTDAVQALGKLAVRMDSVPVTLAAFSAHKLGGPRGSGALFVRRGTQLHPLLHGGGQERGLRSGTEDVAAALGFALAAELAEAEREVVMTRIAALRDRLEAGLCERVPGLRVNAAAAPRLPTISNVSAPGADAEMLLMALDLEGLAASSGSACSSGAVEPSHVLTAMGLPADVAGPSVRFSLGLETTDADIDRALEIFPGVIERLRG
jgi:cysteine desulfurase